MTKFGKAIISGRIIPETIGERIAFCRLKKGLTQQELAETLGTIQKVIAIWETDRSIPKTENMFRIAKTLGVSVEYLVSGRDDVDHDPISPFDDDSVSYTDDDDDLAPDVFDTDRIPDIDTEDAQ